MTSRHPMTAAEQATAPEGSVGVAARLARLDPDERAEVFQGLPGQLADEAFVLLDPAYQGELLARLPEARGRALVERLTPDDRAHLVDEVPDEVGRWILAGVSESQRDQTSALLEYPPETAGHVMTPSFLALGPEMSVREAIDEVRRRAGEVETIYVLPIVGDAERFEGVIELRDLLLCAPDERLREVMTTEAHAVPVDMDQEAVVRLIMAADRLAVPVLEHDGRIVGLVTVDDAMDILSLEEAEDLARTGASEPLERPYFTASIFKLARSRVVWLLVLVVAATLTVNVLNAFEATLEEVVSLALFIPLLIGTGGNAGAQSATTLVRAMAVDEVRPRDLLRVMGREAVTGATLGGMLGLLSVVPVWVFVGRDLSVVIALSLFSICTLASVVGATMPLLARRVGVDPAVVSAPFVTTIVDATGLLVYFLIAKAIMGV